MGMDSKLEDAIESFRNGNNIETSRSICDNAWEVKWAKEQLFRAGDEEGFIRLRDAFLQGAENQIGNRPCSVGLAKSYLVSYAYEQDCWFEKKRNLYKDGPRVQFVKPFIPGYAKK